MQCHTRATFIFLGDWRARISPCTFATFILLVASHCFGVSGYFTTPEVR
jgi:hypothetical protein